MPRRLPTARSSMSTGRAELSRIPALVATLCLLPLAACSDDPAPSMSSDAAVADARHAVGRVLEARGRALTGGHRAAFLGTLDDDDPSFVAQQTAYFDNLARLPVGSLDYRLDPETLEADPAGEGVWAAVEVRLRLDGYDAAPVRTRDRFLFEETRAGRYRVAGVSTSEPQPWDEGPVAVREDAGVLGVFDASTVDASPALLDAVVRARAEVVEIVPAAGPAGVVVLATSDLPLPTGLDAVTVPVPVDPGRPRGAVASYRFLLGPEVLGQPAAVLDRLVRHELTHVVLGDRGRGAPLWLTEGVAEYVSVQPMAPADRRLPASALSLVTGGLDDLPADEVFLGDDARAWYAVAWWICEYVAREHDESTLWWLLDELAGGADQVEVLDRVLGLTPAELARRGAALMASTYGG